MNLPSLKYSQDRLKHIFWQLSDPSQTTNIRSFSRANGLDEWLDMWFSTFASTQLPKMLQEKNNCRSHLNYPIWKTNQHGNFQQMWWRCASVFGILVSNVGKKLLANVFAGPQLINSSSSVLNKQVNPSTTYQIQYYWGFPISKHYIPSNTIVFFIEPKRTQLSMWHLFD